MNPETIRQLPKIVSKYRMPHYGKAIRQIITSFVPFLIIRSVMYYSMSISYRLVIPLAIINAFFLVRIFIIQHDCGHQSFTSSTVLNNFIGRCCSMLTRIPYTYRAKSHNFHHNHNSKLRKHRDIGDIHTYTVQEYSQLSRFRKLIYRIFRSAPVMFGLWPAWYVIVQWRLPLVWITWRSKERRSLIRSNLVLAVIYWTIRFALGWQALVFIQLPVLLCFGTIAIRFFYVQHQHELTYKAREGKRDYVTAAIQWSSYYDLPGRMHWLTGNIGYHHIHHLNASIPSYQLPRCFRENTILKDLANRLTFTQSLSSIFNHLWDEQQQKMISFRMYRTLYKPHQHKQHC